MRRILLTLADDTTETHCGSCDHLTADVCHISGPLAYATRGAKTPTRHVDCLAAEAAAARMVEIAPEDAKILHMLVGDYADQWDTEGTLRQLRSTLRAHAKKAEVKR